MGLLERLNRKAEPGKAVLYARFSSDNQRSESIDAQIRACKDFASRNNIIIISEYVDRAKSAVTDDRPEFQKMLKDSSKKEFDIVLVHKLDRFARNRNDSIVNRSKLKKNGVSLLSVTEPLDDEKPESIILEAVLEAMAEYYSKNLAREVKKGMKENALKAKHTGGKPPLGYDIDPSTRELVINETEAEAVKLIFSMVIEGKGYGAIVRHLNNLGFKTKLGRIFGKNSLYEILRNPKYKGVYVYNKAASADPYTHTRNSHQWRDKSDMIILPDKVPQIISEEDFEAVQQILQKRRRHNEEAKHHKEVYLLTGKIFCGKCGCRYSGNRKKSAGNRVPNITYRCNNRSRRTGVDCDNKEVNRDYLEAFVLKQIEEAIFNEKTAQKLIKEIQDYVESQNLENNAALQRLRDNLSKIEEKENNLAEILANDISSDTQKRILLQKLDELDSKHKKILEEIESKQKDVSLDVPTLEDVKKCFAKAKKLFRKKELAEQQSLINMYVEKIIVYEDEVEIILNLIPFIYQKIFSRYKKYINRKGLRDFFYSL